MQDLHSNNSFFYSINFILMEISIPKSQKMDSQTNLKTILSLSDFRKQLPIAKSRDDIIKQLRSNQISIISGDTGSGKSTQIPQYIYEENINMNKTIAITQPRRVAAITLAQRVAQEVIFSFIQ